MWILDLIWNRLRLDFGSNTCSYETATYQVWTRNTKLNSMVNTKIFTALANIIDRKY